MNRGETTLHEIRKQPEVWEQCLKVLKTLNWEELVGNRNPKTHEWIFVGCGTSYYLAQAAAATFTRLTGRLARAVPASEILLVSNLVFPLQQGPCFPVLISRSGHTSEVVRVAELLRQQKLEFLSITCDGNELQELSPRVIKLPVTEESTVMTSSFTSMLMALQYIAAWFGGNQEFMDALQTLPASLSRLLKTYDKKIEGFAQKEFEDIAILAQGALYPIAQEVALKVMESSSSYAQFFHTLEFRHGPKSIVSEKTLVGALLSEEGFEEESQVLLEMKELGAHALAVTNHATDTLRQSCDLVIEHELAVPELAQLIVYVVWGQLLGSFSGIRKGLDPDNPRNLSRVVTI